MLQHVSNEDKKIVMNLAENVNKLTVQNNIHKDKINVFYRTKYNG